jgi:Ribonucleotide reductase, all-alpha domain.
VKVGGITPSAFSVENKYNRLMKTYTYEEAMAASLDYFRGDDLAASVWINKYAMKDSFGNLYEKSPEEMHQRLAAEFARIEERYPNPMSADEILELFEGL